MQHFDKNYCAYLANWKSFLYLLCFTFHYFGCICAATVCNRIVVTMNRILLNRQHLKYTKTICICIDYKINELYINTRPRRAPTTHSIRILPQNVHKTRKREINKKNHKKSQWYLENVSAFYETANLAQRPNITFILFSKNSKQINETPSMHI